jgi:hypothetical protein
MKERPLFHIGQDFMHPHSGGVHRVTDVGTRTFLTINTTSGTIATHETKTAKGPPGSSPAPNREATLQGRPTASPSTSGTSMAKWSCRTSRA